MVTGRTLMDSGFPGPAGRCLHEEGGAGQCLAPQWAGEVGKWGRGERTGSQDGTSGGGGDSAGVGGQGAQCMNAEETLSLAREGLHE